MTWKNPVFALSLCVAVVLTATPDLSRSIALLSLAIYRGLASELADLTVHAIYIADVDTRARLEDVSPVAALLLLYRYLTLTLLLLPKEMEETLSLRSLVVVEASLKSPTVLLLSKLLLLALSSLVVRLKQTLVMLSTLLLLVLFLMVRSASLDTEVDVSDVPPVVLSLDPERTARTPLDVIFALQSVHLVVLGTRLPLALGLWRITP